MVTTDAQASVVEKPHNPGSNSDRTRITVNTDAQAQSKASVAGYREVEEARAQGNQRMAQVGDPSVAANPQNGNTISGQDAIKANVTYEGTDPSQFSPEQRMKYIAEHRNDPEALLRQGLITKEDIERLYNLHSKSKDGEIDPKDLQFNSKTGELVDPSEVDLGVKTGVASYDAKPLRTADMKTEATEPAGGKPPLAPKKVETDPKEIKPAQGRDAETKEPAKDPKKVEAAKPGAVQTVGKSALAETQEKKYDPNPNQKEALGDKRPPGAVVASSEEQLDLGGSAMGGARGATIGDANNGIVARRTITGRQEAAGLDKSNTPPEAASDHHPVPKNPDGTDKTVDQRIADSRKELDKTFGSKEDQARLDNLLKGMTPEQQAKTLENLAQLQKGMAGSIHERQFQKDMRDFTDRASQQNLSPEQRAKSLENLAAISRGDFINGNNNRFDVGNADPQDVDRMRAAMVKDRVPGAATMSLDQLENYRRQSAIAGGMHDIARPKDIDQGNRGICNSTTVLEGVAHDDPATMTARLREATLHGTYTGSDGFQAKIPPQLMMQQRETAGSQNIDGTLNYSTQLLTGGQLNHYWQERGQYYTAWDNKGGGVTEARFAFANNRNNPFTNNYMGEGASVGLNDVAFMGRNMGIKGDFVYARPEWLPKDDRGRPIVGAGVRVVNSADELTRAKQERADKYGSNWGIAGVSAYDKLFTGANGIAGNGGGHVVSTYKDGYLSNQWGKGNDKEHVADSDLFAAMNKNDPSRGRGRGGEYIPGGQHQPGENREWRKWYDSHPNGRNSDGQHGIETPEHKVKREQEEQKKQEELDKKKQDDDLKRKKKAEADDPSGIKPAQLSYIDSQIAEQRRIAFDFSEFNDAGERAAALDRLYGFEGQRYRLSA